MLLITEHYTDTNMRTHADTNVRTHADTNVRTHADTNVRTHADTNVRTHADTNMRTHADTNMRTHAHTGFVSIRDRSFRKNSHTPLQLKLTLSKKRERDISENRTAKHILSSSPS